MDDLRGIEILPCFGGVDVESELVALAEDDPVAVANTERADPLTVDECAVRALQVLNSHRSPLRNESGVASRHVKARQQEIGASAPPDHDLGSGDEIFLRLSVRSLPFQSGSIHERTRMELNRRRHDGLSPREDFHAEADVDSTNLQEASAKRTSGESRSSLRREKPSTANDNLAGTLRRSP